MPTTKTYRARAQRTSEKWARLRKRRAELRMAAPPPDYPPIRIPGMLLRSITLRNHVTGTVTIIELREPKRARSDQFAVKLNGKPWPKHARPIGIAEIRKAIV